MCVVGGRGLGEGADVSAYRSGLSLQPRPPGTPVPGGEEETMLKQMVKFKGSVS